MPWQPIQIDDVRLTPTERAVMKNIQGDDMGARILLNVVGEFIGAIRAGGYDIATDGSIPDIGREHVINRTRWLWLAEFPTLKNMQTDARSKLNDAAVEFFQNVSNGKMNIESPTAAAPVPAAKSFVRRPIHGRMSGECQ